MAGAKSHPKQPKSDERANASSQSEQLTFTGQTYRLVKTADEVLTGFQARAMVAYAFAPDDAESVMRSLVQACRTRQVDPKNVFAPTLWVCTRCATALARDLVYLFWAANKPVAQTVRGGKTSQQDVAAFRNDRSCPACHNRVFAFLSPSYRDDLAPAEAEPSAAVPLFSLETVEPPPYVDEVPAAAAGPKKKWWQFWK